MDLTINENIDVILQVTIKRDYQISLRGYEFDQLLEEHLRNKLEDLIGEVYAGPEFFIDLHIVSTVETTQEDINKALLRVKQALKDFQK